MLKGLEMLRNNFKDSNRHSTIILLTDGEPNIFPPSGFEDQLTKYKFKHPNFLFSFNTFAFGKKTDSQLLYNLAMIGHGEYSFIPCPGFIGTIFVNTLSNLLSTMGVRMVININCLNGSKIKDFEGKEVD